MKIRQCTRLSRKQKTGRCGDAFKKTLSKKTLVRQREYGILSRKLALESGLDGAAMSASGRKDSRAVRKAWIGIWN